MTGSLKTAALIVGITLVAVLPNPILSAPSTVNLSNNAGESRFPDIGLNGTTLIALWEDTTPGAADLFMRRSLNAGVTWGPVVNVTGTPGDAGPGWEGCYWWAFNGRFIHLVWMDNSPGNADVLYRRSETGGQTWSGILNLSNNAGSSNCPVIDISGQNVYVFWSDDSSGNLEILFRRSTDGGATFGPTVNISNSAATSDAVRTRVAGPHVYVAWRDGAVGSREIFMRHSADGGATFAPVVSVSSTPSDSSRVRFRVAGQNVYVAYVDNATGNDDVYFRLSVDGGLSFLPAVNLSSNAGPSIRGGMEVAGSHVYVVWQDATTGNNDTLFRRSTNGGTTWDPAQNVTSNPGDSIWSASQQLSAGTQVFIASFDNTTGNYDVVYRRSTDAGATFEPTVNLSANAGESRWPIMIQVGRDVYAVWDDMTTGNREILFTRSVDGGNTWLIGSTATAVAGGVSGMQGEDSAHTDR